MFGIMGIIEVLKRQKHCGAVPFVTFVWNVLAWLARLYVGQGVRFTVTKLWQKCGKYGHDVGNTMAENSAKMMTKR